jgi:hypothetical protein
MGSLNCTECGRTFTFDVIPKRGAVCFKCHVGSIRFGFQQGQQMFHDKTIKEQEREIIDSAKREGRNIEYIGNKWV